MSGTQRTGVSIGAMLLIVGLGCGTVIALAPDIAAGVLVLQLPGVLAWLVDPTPGRAVGRTMLLFQGAASIRPILSIWFACDGLNACVKMALDPSTYLVVLLATIFGFGLTQILPIVLKLFDEDRVRKRRANLQAERAKIAEEWDLDG